MDETCITLHDANKGKKLFDGGNTLHYTCTQMKRTRATDGPFTIRLNAETRNKLRHIARKNNLAEAVLVREALRARLPVWEQKGITFRG